jgi:hypothetical protein
MSTPDPKNPTKFTSNNQKPTPTTFSKALNFERYANPHTKGMRKLTIIGTCAFFSIIGYFMYIERKDSSKQPKKK